jgi:ABC-type multidrug transport system fused ATPase/permease subunit
MFNLIIYIIGIAILLIIKKKDKKLFIISLAFLFISICFSVYALYAISITDPYTRFKLLELYQYMNLVYYIMTLVLVTYIGISSKRRVNRENNMDN